MTLLGLTAVLAPALLTGCGPGRVSSPPPTAAVPLSFAAMFDSHFVAPARFGELHGLALYNTAIDPGPGPHAPSGSGHFVLYALINNRDPVEGVLVGVRTPMTLSFFRERLNASALLSGSLHTMEEPELVTWFAQHHGIHLATTDQGLPYWIEGTEVPTAVPQAASSPLPLTAPHPPSVSAPPASPHATPAENEPFDRELVFQGP
jgi:hypothetical protein